MQKYSFLTQILNKQFLGDGEILDYSIKRIQKNSYNIELEQCNYVFITGLARSGTTALLNFLDKTNKFSSLRYKYMPFILMPKIAQIFSKLFMNNNKNVISERLHGDGILIGQSSPECLDEPFWINTIYKKNLNNNFMSPHSIDSDLARSYGYLLNKYALIENKKRMLIKNNNSHLRLLSTSSYFPNSKFLVVFRSPIAQAISLLNLHKRISKFQRKDKYVLEYMNLIGHWEFGLGKKFFVYKKDQEKTLKSLNPEKINYWLMQWIFTYEWINNNLSDKKNIIFICYEQLCKDDNYKMNLFKLLNIKQENNLLKFKLGRSNNHKDLYEKEISIKDLKKSENIYSQLKKKSNFALNF